jgi:hypothetical protein
MAAMIVTISQVSDPEINIQIKVNDGAPIPTTIATDDIQRFRTWATDIGHLFLWKDADGLKKSMFVPHAYIGWVMSALPGDNKGDIFRIQEPCSVTLAEEIIPI